MSSGNTDMSVYMAVARNVEPGLCTPKVYALQPGSWNPHMSQIESPLKVGPTSLRPAICRGWGRPTTGAAGSRPGASSSRTAPGSATTSESLRLVLTQSCGRPKIRGLFLGVLITRIIVYWGGSILRPLFLETRMYVM